MPSPTAPTRAERRDAARALRREHEAADRRAAKRARALKQIAAVAAAAVAIVAIMIAASNGPDTERAVDTPPPAATASLFAGIPQRGIALGSPDAPVTVVEFADLQCPFCGEFARETLPGILERYVRTGKVRLELQILAFLGEDSVKGARAAADAAERNRLWQFTDRFYQMQGTENSGYVTDDFLRKVDPATLDADAAAGDRAIATASREAERFAIRSTPTFVIGGRVVDSTGVEAAIAKAVAS